ncbi:hypothetical protein CARUB_v10011997mg [Capsella rubella]|uniref:DUF220 domain-containing protein n=1 Tax=Capsella rubella TaxID=81985 RepID=R0IIG1_9BRAS|nr:uncharacterized protein LOC17899201 [Capsella rubella]EOA36668.1 hypothetical protein CARUB_v10011997mg [Capsella rubella]
MGIFPEFGGWIDQNTQQEPLKADSKRSENVKSESGSSDINTCEERDEMKEQLTLWRESEKKKQWYDPPPKVKVERRNDLVKGMTTIDMEFTLGLPPQAAYDVLTNPDNQQYSRIIKGHYLLENISRKVVSPDTGKGKMVQTKKAIGWNFLYWSGAIPITASFLEQRKLLTVDYSIENEMFINMLEGQYKLEPLFVDSERFCKHMKPKCREEYEKCSCGQGRIATKVKVEQVFKPTFLFNLPPLSWLVRRITIKVMKTIIQDLQINGAVIRGV